MSDQLPDFNDVISQPAFVEKQPAPSAYDALQQQEIDNLRPQVQVPKMVDQMVDENDDPDFMPTPPSIADENDPRQFKPTPDTVVPETRKDPRVLDVGSWNDSITRWLGNVDKSVTKGATTGAVTIGVGLGATMAEIERTLPQKKVEDSLMSSLSFAIEEKDPAQRKINQANIRAALPSLFPNKVDRDNAQRLISDAFEDPAAFKALQEEVGKQWDPFNDNGFKALFATQKWIDDTFAPAPDFAGTWSDKLAGGAGSMLTFLAATYFGGSATGFSAGALSGQGEAFQRALQNGAPGDLALKAAMLGTIPGLTENVPIEVLLKNPKMTNIFFGLIVNAGRQAVLEGGQEAVQQVMQNAIAQYLYKPDQLLGEGVGESFVLGGALGAGAATAVGLVGLRGRYYDKATIRRLNEEWERQRSRGATEFDPGPIPPPAIGTPADPNANPLPPSVRGALEPVPTAKPPEDRGAEKPAGGEAVPQEPAAQPAQPGQEPASRETPGEPVPPPPKLSDVAPGEDLAPGPGTAELETAVTATVRDGEPATPEVQRILGRLTPEQRQILDAEGLRQKNTPEEQDEDFEPSPELLAAGHALELSVAAELAPEGSATAKILEQGPAPAIETPEFRQWFKDSKVTENGKPLVVYHGTDADFRAFERSEDIGFHFGTVDQAQTRINEGDPSVGVMMPVYLSLQNPLRLPDLHTWDPDLIISRLVHDGIITEEQGDGEILVDREQVKSWLYAKGYDSIVYSNENEGKGDSYIAFEPTQIKSAIGNVGTFDVRDPDISRLSVPLRTGEETLEEFGIGPMDKPKVREVAAALEARQRAKFGQISFDDRSDASRDKLADWLATEVQFELHPGNIDKSAAGWYTDKFQRALDTFGTKYPQLTDDAAAAQTGNATGFRTKQDARDLLTALFAITSDGQRVNENFKSADRVFAAYLAEGRLPATVEGARGDRSASMTKNMLRMQKLIDDLGIEGMTRYLLTERKVSDINAELRAMGRGDEISSKLPASALMPQAAVEFGPKLGAFYANLMGTQGYLTMDMWWARTFNRMRGQLLTKPSETGMKRVGQMVMQQRGLKKPPSEKKLLEIITEEAERYKAKGYKDGTELERAANTLFKDAFVNLEESPLGASDRAFMISTAKRSQEMLRERGYDLTIADIQALIWYYEKRLYGELGAKQSDDISYEEAAQKAVGTGADLGQPRPDAEGARGAVAGRARPAAPAPRSLGERLANFRSAIAAIRDSGAAPGARGKAWDDGGGRDGSVDGSPLTYKPTPAAAAILKQQGVPVQPVLEHGADHAPAFHAAISSAKAASKFGAAVYVYPVEEYAEMRLFSTKDGKSGFAIKPDGDIVSVFSDGSGVGPMMLQLAIEQGGTKLDAFDTVLPEIYRAAGFVEVSRQPWNEDYKPEGWDYRTFAPFNNGQPDVVFMEYRAPAIDAVSKTLTPQAPPAPHPKERRRPSKGIASPAGPREATMSKEELFKEFSRALNLTVEQGRFGRGNSDAAAIYKWGQSVARVRSQGALTELYHEGGHHIHAMMGAYVDAVIAQHEAEIENIAMTIYGGGGVIDIANRQLVRTEGFATWFEMWMNNPAEASVVAPRFTPSFEAMFNKQAAELAGTLKMIREQTDKLLTEKPSRELIRDRMVPFRKDTTVSRIRDSIKDGNFLHDVGTLFNRIYQGGLDQNHSLTVAVRRLKQIAEANVRRLVDMGALDRAGAARTLEALDRRGRRNPVKMLALAKNAYNVSSEMLATGSTDWNGDGSPTSLGLPAILAIVNGGANKRLDPQIYQDFNEYLMARRMVQEYDNYNETRKWHAAKERGVKYPEPRTKRYRVPDDASQSDWVQALTELHKQYPQFDRAAQELYKFQTGILKWRRDAGDLTDDLFQYMSGMQNYVPARRDMGDERFGAAFTGGKDGKTGKDNLLRVFRGSSRPLMNPIESIMQAVVEQVALTMNNQVKRSLVDLALDVGQNSGAIVEKIPATEMKGTAVRLADVLKAAGDFPLAEEIANAMGRDEITMEEFMDEVLDGDEVGTIWRQVDTKERGEKIIYVHRAGKVEAYKLNDPEWADDLYQTLTELGKEQTNLLVRILAKPAAFLRAGVTTSPPFLIANIIRDQIGAWVLNDGVFPGVALARGMKGDLFDRKSRRIYNLSGAAIGGSNIAALDKTRFGTEQTRLAKLGIGVTAEATLTGALKVIDSSETWSRQGIWAAAFKKAKADGLSDADAMAEAGFESSDYANYGRAGSKMLVARRLITFLNANLQGLDKSMRVWAGGEGGAAAFRKQVMPAVRRMFNMSGPRTSLPLTTQERDQVQRGMRSLTKAMSLALVSAMLAIMNWDDEEYDTFSPYLKGTRWMIKIAPGQWLAIPKPFQLAVFATGVEYAIDGVLKDDPTALANFIKSQAAVLAPPYENPAIRLFYETMTNKNLFTGREIVAPEVAGMPGWLQYDQYTSELGKTIGKFTGASPMLVDHYITSAFATWGRGALSLSNLTNSSRPTQGWDDMAFTSYFIKNGARSSTVRPAFWNLMAQRSGELTGVASGYKKLMDAGAEGQAEQFLGNVTEDQKIFAQLYYHQDVDGKRLHPLRNASDVSTIISSMRKEITLNQLKADKGKGDLMVLSPTQQKLLNDRLGDLAVREMRNAMVITGEPGFGQRKILPTLPIYEQIKQLDPRIATELKKRMQGKVYEFDKVRQLWPRVRSEILIDGAKANLRPMISQAKAGGTKFFTMEGATP